MAGCGLVFMGLAGLSVCRLCIVIGQYMEQPPFLNFYYTRNVSAMLVFKLINLQVSASMYIG